MRWTEYCLSSLLFIFIAANNIHAEYIIIIVLVDFSYLTHHIDGSNGKPPPVLTKRITTPQFPCEFNLSSLDLTQEGAALLLEDGTSFGFEGKDLIISARFDTDGIASTRDPNDLVGRAMFAGKLRLDDGHQIITLSGRGITGKLVTGKK